MKKLKLNANVVGGAVHSDPLKQNRGITLIALIITIIVMLILVGVTINVALNGGLFVEAENAKIETQKAIDKEILQAAVIAAMNKEGIIPNADEITNNLPNNEWNVEKTDEGLYKCISPYGNVFIVDVNGIITYDVIESPEASNEYCLINIEAPEDAKIVVTVPQDSLKPDNSTNSGENTGTIEGVGTLSLEVKKDVNVVYTISKKHYIDNTGNFFAGTQTKGEDTNNIEIGEVNSQNQQTVKISLLKQIFEHTITSAGATIEVSGKLLSSEGEENDETISGTDTVTFYVWAGENNVSYTVSKEYYDSKTASLDIASNGETTNITLSKTKYFIQNCTYSYLRNGSAYTNSRLKWHNTGKLGNVTSSAPVYNSNDGYYDRVIVGYAIGQSSGDIARINGTAPSGMPNEWKLYVDGCTINNYVSLENHSATRLTVLINGTTVLTRTDLPVQTPSNTYTTTGTGEVTSIRLNFTVTSSAADRVIYLDSVYFVVND